MPFEAIGKAFGLGGADSGAAQEMQKKIGRAEQDWARYINEIQTSRLGQRRQQSIGAIQGRTAYGGVNTVGRRSAYTQEVIREIDKEKDFLDKKLEQDVKLSKLGVTLRNNTLQNSEDAGSAQAGLGIVTTIASFFL